MRHRSLLAVLLALALGLGAAACGGGDEGDGETGLTDTGSLFPADTGVFEEPPAAEPPPASPVLQIRVPKPGDAIGPQSPAARVAELQEALLALGFKVGKADGIYGAKTRKAVTRFQKQHKLEADGLVGPKTAKAINRELEKLGA